MKYTVLIVITLFSAVQLSAQFQLQDVDVSTRTDSSSMTHIRKISYAHRIALFLLVKNNGLDLNETDVRANFSFANPEMGLDEMPGSLFLERCFKVIKPYWKDSIPAGQYYFSIGLDSSGSIIAVQSPRPSTTLSMVIKDMKSGLLEGAVFSQKHMPYNEVMVVFNRADEITSEEVLPRLILFEDDGDIDQSTEIRERKRFWPFKCRRNG